MSSGNTINYSIRPNKNIERKLIAEILMHLMPQFPIREYRYIGFGCYWFADFILFHKLFKFRNMISIEKIENAARAKFNQPYKCIKVIDGDSTKILPTLDLENQKSIYWLDYDSTLGGSALDDINILCSKAKANSILIFTVNAHANQLLTKQLNDETETEIKVRNIKNIFGELISDDVSSALLSKNKFPKYLIGLLNDYCKRATRKSGRVERYFPIFSFSYSDNSPMVTIGGMVVDENSLKKLQECNLNDQLDYVTGNACYEINVPPLTLKEKAMLDQLLPSQNSLTPTRAQAKLGFSFSSEQLEGYQKFYKFYPIFGEVYP